MTLYYMATIDVRVIKVLLDTNIPGSEILPLTKSILYQPKMDTSKWNEMPFFTMDAEYPESYLSRMTYEQQMEFFFNKKKMIEILRMKSSITELSGKIELKTQAQIKTETQEKQTIEKEIKEKNADLTRQIDDFNTELQIGIETLKTIYLDDTTDIKSKIMTELIGEKIVFKDKKFKTQNETPVLIHGLKEYDDFDKFQIDYNTHVKNVFSILEYIDDKIELFKFIPGKSCDNVKENNVIFENQDKDLILNGLDIMKDITESFYEIEQILGNTNSEYVTKIEDLVELDITIGFIQTELGIDLENNELEGHDAILDKLEKIISHIKTHSINIKQQNEILCSIMGNIERYIDEEETIDDILDVFTKYYTNILKKYQTEIKEKSDKLQADITNITSYYGEKKIVLNNQITDLSSKKSGKVSKIEYEKNRNKIGETNMMIMIRFMFPTKYPLVGNIFSSFHSVVTGKNEVYLKWTDFIPAFFKKQVFEGIKDYSYLKIKDAIYTVTQAIWLNDIYNHKEYKQLIDKFEQLQRWKDKEITKSENELEKKYELFKQTYESGTFQLSDIDIKNIDDAIENIDKKIGEADNSQVRGYENARASTLKKIKDILINVKKSLSSLVDLFKADRVDKYSLIDNATKFIEGMSILRDKQDYKTVVELSNPTKYDNIRKKMKDDLDNIEADRVILETYLKRPGINMDYEKDTKYRPIIERKYNTYTRFIENIRNFRAPILESSNIELQGSIEDFLNNTEKVKNVFIYMMNPNNVKGNPFTDIRVKNKTFAADILEYESNYQNRLNTGITIRPSAKEGDPYYEVYIQINVIGGEVNDENKSIVDCMYQGESLGDKLERLLNEAIYFPWTMNNSRIFFDITTGEAKVQIEKQEKDKKEKATKENSKSSSSSSSSSDSSSSKTSTEKKGGGTRRFRELLIKTRRRYPMS